MYIKRIDIQSNKLLTGNYLSKIDGKRRIVIPMPLRRNLVGKLLYLVEKREKKCLLLYSEDKWEKIRESLQETEREQFCINSFSVNIDKQGRLLIPQQVFEEIGFSLSKPLRVEGIGEAIRIYQEKEKS